MSAIILTLSLACTAAALRILHQAKQIRADARRVLADANRIYGRAVEEGERTVEIQRDTRALLGELQ